MGNTIRRQPVNFGIPSAPDYKFLNVVDFRGIDVSDNPFVVKQNTASDALNVYVDESNALTTRPRLNLEYELEINDPNYIKTLHVYELSSCTLFQCKMTTGVNFYMKKNNTLTKIEPGVFNNVYIEFTDAKYSVFDVDDNIYLSEKDQYLVIKKDNMAHAVFNDDDTYVPITHTGSVDLGVEFLTGYEDDNMLSDKYRIAYHWDLESDYSDVLRDGVVVDNKYVETKTAPPFFTTELNQIGYLKDNVVLDFAHMNITAFNGTLSPVYFGSSGALYPTTTYTKQTTLPFEYIGDKDVYMGQITPSTSYKDVTSYYGDGLIGCLIGTSTGTEMRIVYQKGAIIYFTIQKGTLDDLNATQTAGLNSKNISFRDETDKLSAFFVYSDKYGSYTPFLTTTNNMQKAGSLLTQQIPNGICCTSTGDAFIVGKQHGITVVMGDISHRTVADLPTISNYVFDGVAKDALLTTDSLSTIIAVLVNKNELNNPDASDWKIVAYTRTENGYSIKEIHTNTDKNMKYYFLKLYMDDNLTKLAILYDNRKKATFNNLYYIVDFGTENQSVLSFTCAEIYRNARSRHNDRLEVQFSSDLSKIGHLKDASASSDEEFIHYSIDFSNNAVKLKTTNPFNLLNNVSPELWRMSPTGDYIRFNSEIGADNNTQDTLYTWFVESNKILTTAIIHPDEHTIFFWLYMTYDAQKIIGYRGYSENGDFDTDGELSICSYGLSTSTEPSLIVEYNKPSGHLSIVPKFNGVCRFDNNYFFYGVTNTIYISNKSDPTYISRSIQIGNTDDPVKDMIMIAYDTAMAFKEKNIFIIQPHQTELSYGYKGIEAKSVIGAASPQAAIISPLSETPMYVGLTGVYAIQSLKNVQSSDKMSVLYSEAITNLSDSDGKLKFMDDLKKKNIITTKRLYWTLFISPGDKSSNIYVLDDRTHSWFVWNVPINVNGCWTKDDVVYVSDVDGKVYSLVKTDILNKYNPNLLEYYDYGEKLIPWYWHSQILPMGTINYSKKLIDTTFILSDTDTTDEYGLNYKFKIFRKSTSETKETTIQNNINYVQSTTKRTLIPRFNFIQLELSNIENDLNNNKLRLIGLGLKYVLLEGLY